MNRDAILKAIRSLACSQGMYGRIYDQLTDGSDESEEVLAHLEGQNFGNAFDLVMYLECA